MRQRFACSYMILPEMREVIQKVKAVIGGLRPVWGRLWSFFHDFLAYYSGGGAGQSDPDSTPLYKGEIPERTRSQEMRGWRGIWHRGRVNWLRKTRALE